MPVPTEVRNGIPYPTEFRGHPILELWKLPLESQSLPWYYQGSPWSRIPDSGIEKTYSEVVKSQTRVKEAPFGARWTVLES